MTGQPEITQVTVGPSRLIDPSELLCYARILLCSCLEVGEIRLVTDAKTGQAKIHFLYTLQIDLTGQARRRELLHPVNPATCSMIAWAVLRAYHDWLNTYEAHGCHDKILAKELAS